MDRDIKTGRWVKGNKAGPGRPKRETERAYIAAAVGTVSEKDWRGIIDKVKQKALRGDMNAVRFLYDLLVGAGELDSRIARLEAELPKHGVGTLLEGGSDGEWE